MLTLFVPVLVATRGDWKVLSLKETKQDTDFSVLLFFSKIPLKGIILYLYPSGKELLCKSHKTTTERKLLRSQAHSSEYGLHAPMRCPNFSVTPRTLHMLRIWLGMRNVILDFNVIKLFKEISLSHHSCPGRDSQSCQNRQGHKIFLYIRCIFYITHWKP